MIFYAIVMHKCYHLITMTKDLPVAVHFQVPITLYLTDVDILRSL